MKLTIIIPFLNEGEEVRNTVNSIREYSNSHEVAIILINDASDDKFNYEEVANEFNTEYVKNENRIGVAASRDLGVELCKTPYFLFLDAHMRFYNNVWVNRIVQELDCDSRSILCCQTRGLFVVDNELIINKKRPTSYGVSIDFYNEEFFFEHHWIFEEDKEFLQLDTVPIPCIMGAAYACSKSYWTYLKGLDGLMYYGNDESYVSMKIWLEGGTCKLLKDVVVGHIYRDTPPYIIENAPRLYNRLLLAELLLPYLDKVRVFSGMKGYYRSIFNDAMYLFYQNREKIYNLKVYYKGVFQNDFSFYEQINNRFHTFNSIHASKSELLQNIAHHLILNCCTVTDIGLLDGKLGIVLFLFHYSRYSKNDVYSLFAEQILDDVLSSINGRTSTNFCDGLSGIGWAIEYLYKNNFLEGDINDSLEVIDKKMIEEIGASKMKDPSLETGFGGILHYILARLYTIKNEDKCNPFSSDILHLLYDWTKCILNDRGGGDCVDVFFKYIVFYESLSVISKPSVYDIAYLALPTDFQIEKFTYGLSGNAGVGLKLIFEDLR